MITDYARRRDVIIRRALSEIRASSDQASKLAQGERLAYEGQVRAILEWYDGRGRDQIKAAYKVRYGLRRRAANAEAGTPEMYVKSTIADMIDNDMTEVVQLGLLRAVCDKLGSLFSYDTQRWQYYGEDGEEIPDLADLVGEARRIGGFATAMIRADRTAVAAKYGAVRIHWRDGLRYAAIDPTDIAVLYGDSVREGEGGEAIPVDTTDLEDASAVIMREATQAEQISTAVVMDDGSTRRMTTGSTSGLAVYSAWVGRCEDLPAGRYVRYQADASSFLSIPDIGASGIVYEHPDGNPLTALQNSDGIEAVPCEYPFVVLTGGYVSSLQDAPDDQLLWNDIDMSLSLSRSLTAAMVNARGVTAIKNPLGRMLPTTIEEGCVALQEDQEIIKLSNPAGAAREAMEATFGLARVVGASYGVPMDNLRADGAPSVESGIAILLRQLPLEEARRMRATMNSGAVSRLWDIERTMLNAYGGETIPDTVTQQWVWGNFTPPIDLEAMSRRHEAELRIGTIDLADAVAERHGISRAEAERKIAAMNEAKAAEAPAPVEAPKPQNIMERLGLKPRGARPGEETTA
jgi:hypothetical protein